MPVGSEKHVTEPVTPGQQLRPLSLLCCGLSHTSTWLSEERGIGFERLRRAFGEHEAELCFQESGRVNRDSRGHVLNHRATPYPVIQGTHSQLFYSQPLCLGDRSTSSDL